MNILRTLLTYAACVAVAVLPVMGLSGCTASQVATGADGISPALGAEYRQLTNDLASLEAELAAAEAAGDFARVAELEPQIAAMSDRAEEIETAVFSHAGGPIMSTLQSIHPGFIAAAPLLGFLAPLLGPRGRKRGKDFLMTLNPWDDKHSTKGSVGLGQAAVAFARYIGAVHSSEATAAVDAGAAIAVPGPGSAPA